MMNNIRFRRRGDTQELTAQLPTQPVDLESSGGYIGDGGLSSYYMLEVCY